MLLELLCSPYAHLLAALLALSAYPAEANAGTSDANSLRRQIQQEAKDFCEAPERYGVSISASGNLTGTFKVSKLSRLFVDPKITGNLSGSFSGYYGVLQKDLAGALKSTNDCRLKAFQAFSEFHASITRPKPMKIQPRGSRTGRTDVKLAEIPAAQIFVECRPDVLPNLMGPSGIIYSLEIPPNPEAEFASNGSSMQQAGTPINWYKGQKFNYRCAISTYGTLPISSLRLKLKMLVLQTLNFPAEMGGGEGKGLPTAERVIDFQVNKVEPGAQNAFIFYVQNLSNRYVDIVFPDNARAGWPENGHQQSIKVTAAGMNTIAFIPSDIPEFRERYAPIVAGHACLVGSEGCPKLDVKRSAISSK